MDAILDLTSRAVSLVVLIQDSLLRLPGGGNHKDQQESDRIFHNFEKSRSAILLLDYFQENGAKISWVSVEPETSIAGSSQNCYERCEALIKWMNSEETHAIFETTFSQHNYLPAPEQWREAIREALYANLSQRIILANALQYLPMQVVLTAGNATKLDARQQRLLQIWNIIDPADLKNIISPPDEVVYNQLSATREELIATANTFLMDEQALIKRLEDNSVPLSFLQIFHTELKEIESSRKSRKTEIINCEHLCKPSRDIREQQYATFEQIFKKVLPPVNDISKATNSREPNPGNENLTQQKVNFIPDDGSGHTYTNDVLRSSKQMELWALAFSGGGIRSASFNLGVLQGLAKKGLIGKFDYLSTVSGGGYIGSWLVSWIARTRSVIQVSDLLDPRKSSDPLAEEVRPIRWLRMYSNYLTPTTGIMSADSWTVGMTLVRNMIVNQLVILSLFLTLIAFGRSVFMLWTTWALQEVMDVPILYREIIFNVVCSLFLLAGATLAGMGMQSYHQEKFPAFTVSPAKKEMLPHLLLAVGSIAALLFSGWMLRQATMHTLIPRLFDFGEAYRFFWWIMFISFVSMVVIAVLGRYDTCIDPKVKSKPLELLYGTAYTLAAVLVGGVMLAAVCKFGYYLACQVSNLPGVEYYPEKLCFIFLPPLIIEVLSVTVILRMALLGANFPDERREWWGRIGGLVHRLCLIWVVVLALTMLGKSLIDLLITQRFYIKEFFVAGWGATLIVGIRAAFGGTTSGEANADKSPSPVKEGLALLAPYLFVFAVMIFLPQLLDIIQNAVAALLPEFQSNDPRSMEHNDLHSILLSLVGLAFVTFILSRRIGVNQFSMHLFYRNRLRRAYLGATRIRLERARSANPFTGFDNADDILMAELTSAKDYFGPYPLINTTLSASSDTALDRQDRKAESFIFSPFYCGFDFSRTRASANALKKSYDFAYRPTQSYGYEQGPHIGTAMAISGAAANPNMGYHTSPATSFLLSVFNIRLGWWMGNPRMGKWNEADPNSGLSYLINDLAGSTDTTSDFVCLSDGAHFDNMGLYELIRRNCKYIILSDAEQDETLLCEGLANAVRRCRIDFGVEITFDDIEAITFLDEKRYSKKNYAIGKINYPGNARVQGTLIYIKASMTEKETIDLQEYAKKNKTFPHQSTADQFFNEEQFESYRKLGMNIVDKIMD